MKLSVMYARDSKEYEHGDVAVQEASRPATPPPTKKLQNLLLTPRAEKTSMHHDMPFGKVQKNMLQ